MSNVRKTICDHCGEESQESSPHMSNGSRREWHRVEVKHKFDTAARDACSTACLEIVLRAFADKVSEEARR